jgi:tetratricopeptide (TPR) repeat protein
MAGRLQLTLVLCAAAVLFAPTADVAAQDGGRFRVLIPYFTPLEDADDDFGKDVSKELRELISTLATHVAMEEGDIKDEVKRFDMKIEDLTCITTRQLAAQIDVPVAICATYTENPDKSWTLDAEVWNIQASESFPIDPITVAEKDEEGAAQHIFQQFDQYNTTVRSAAICNDYMASQQWENALRNCNESLALNPNQVSTRFMKARILYEMEDYSEALAELETVIEEAPFNEAALQLAGYISALTERDEQAREYYRQYLELNPGDAQIRMRIAYELGAEAGDPVGAMEFIQEGLDVDPENIALWEQYGGFAFSAALEVQQMAAVGTQDAGTAVVPEAIEYYREAIGAYERVFEAKGPETNVAHLRNIIRAYLQLEELDPALQMTERALQTHSQDAEIWVLHADALQRSGRLDEAIAALDRVREINPDHQTAALRQGNWLIQAGRIADAVEVLSGPAANNPQQAEQAARMIFAEAYQNGYEKDDFEYAIRGVSAAKQLPNLSAEMTGQLNFWHGFSIYQIAVKEQEPQTLETARSSLPKFQEAVELLRQSGDYPATVNVNLAQTLENVATFIEIQEAIIKRGR